MVSGDVSVSGQLHTCDFDKVLVQEAIRLAVSGCRFDIPASQNYGSKYQIIEAFE